MRHSKHGVRAALVALLSCAALTLAGVRPAAAQQQGAARPSEPARTPATRQGNPAPASAALDVSGRAQSRAVDESIPNDPAVDAVVAPYSAGVRALDAPIGKLAGELKKTGTGGGSIGNFVADALRARAAAKLGRPVLLTVVNTGGLRRGSMPAGDVSASDIFQLLPFENALVALDLTGAQLRRLLDVTIARRDLAQSGARITYRNNEQKQGEIVTVKLGTRGDERDIDPAAIYTIVTIDYLVKRGGDYSVLQEAKNVRPLGITMRDAVIEYVKAETAAGRQLRPALDGRFRYDRSAAPAAAEESEP